MAEPKVYEIKDDLANKGTEGAEGKTAPKVYEVDPNNPNPPTPEPEKKVEEVVVEAEKKEIVPEVIEKPKEIAQEEVLTFINSKFNKEYKALEEVFATSDREPLPEDVEQFLKYKKETGRGINDFLELQKDYNAIPEDELLKKYLLATEEGLDEIDIETMMSDYAYDEDIDDERDVAKKKLEKKKALTKAKNYFTEMQGKFKLPLESKGAELPQAEVEEFQAYKERLKAAQEEQEELRLKAEHFDKKTDEVFSEQFKGFEYEVEGKKVIFEAGNPKELKELHRTPLNFVKKFIDAETGLLKDSAGYHKSLNAAMNPDKMAKFFYDLGKAEGIESVDKNIKNINMNANNAPNKVNKEGNDVVYIPPTGNSNFKIKAPKN